MRIIKTTIMGFMPLLLALAFISPTMAQTNRAGSDNGDRKAYYEGTIVITTKGVDSSSGSSIDSKAIIRGVKYEEFMYLPGMGLRFDCTGGSVEAHVLIVNSQGEIYLQYDGDFQLKDQSLGFGFLLTDKSAGTYQLITLPMEIPGEKWVIAFFDVEALKNLPLSENSDRPLVLRGEKTENKTGIPTTITWDLSRHYYK